MAVNFDGSNGGGSGKAAYETARVIHSEARIEDPGVIKVGDFIYVYGPRGTGRRLVKVVDAIPSGVLIEWISGLTLFTALLMYEDYSVVPRPDGGFADEQWLEIAPKSFERWIWPLWRLFVKPYNPADYPNDYHP